MMKYEKVEVELKKQQDTQALFIEHVQKVWDEAACLFDQTSIDHAIAGIAAQLTQDYACKNPILLCLMKGAVVFMGQLLPLLPFPLEVDYIHASRYGNKTVGDTLKWTYHPEAAFIEGRHIILVDDIFDQGATLAACTDWLLQSHCASVESAVLVQKQHDRCLTALKPKYVGLQVPDVFVAGYGLDYKNYLRNAKGIFKITPGLE